MTAAAPSADPRTPAARIGRTVLIALLVAIASPILFAIFVARIVHGGR